jgi:hypothetical protein
MRLFKILLPIFLVTITFFVARESQPQPALYFDADFDCQEYCWDGIDENDEWVSGMGADIILAGTVKANSSMESGDVFATITVRNKHGFRKNAFAQVRLSPGEEAHFKRSLNVEDFWCENDCACFEYDVTFRTADGTILPHIGDYPNTFK